MQKDVKTVTVPHPENPHDSFSIRNLLFLALLFLALLDGTQITLRVDSLRSLLRRR